MKYLWAGVVIFLAYRAAAWLAGKYLDEKRPHIDDDRVAEYHRRIAVNGERERWGGR